MDFELMCDSCHKRNVFEYNQSGIYQNTCKCGHKNEYLLKKEKFELLFDFAGKAILDGYTREAVTSIAVALERFYEYYIQVICFEYNIEDKNFQDFWNNISKQSERQLGSFLSFYLLVNKKLPEIIANKKPKGQIKTWTAFRNHVVHNGNLYSKEVI